MKHISLICLLVLTALPARADFGLSNVVRKEIHHTPGVQVQETVPATPVPEKAPIPQDQPAMPQNQAPVQDASFTKVLHYPYTIHLSSSQDLPQALRQSETLQNKLDMVFVTKIDLGATGIWYRTDYGAFSNIRDAVLKLQELKAGGFVDKGSFVGGSVPYAIELGMFKTRQEALDKARSLSGKKVLPYVIKERDDLYRLLSGAYPDEKSAAPAIKDLAAMNLQPTLKKR